jgi:signal transduction histidine kinase
VGLFPRTLRSQLLCVLLLAIAPLAGLATYIALDDGRRASLEAQDGAQSAVRMVSQDLSNLVQGGRRLILGLSGNLTIRNSPQACNAMMAALHPALPQFANIGIVDSRMQFVCSAVTPIEGLPDRGELKLRAGEVRTQRLSSQPLIPLAGPFDGLNGRGQYYFFATIDLSWLNRQITLTPLPKGAVLLVLNRDSHVIARSPQPDGWIGKQASPEITALLRRGDFTGEVKDSSGAGRVYSVAHVKSAEGLGVVLEIPAADIYRPSRRLLLFHLTALAIVGLLVFGQAWFGAERLFARPISMLVEAARRLGSGDLSSRSGASYAGEIGQLARSFDQMADALEQSQARNHRTSQALRSIIEGTSTSIGEDFFRSLARSLASALDASVAFVGELDEDQEVVRTVAVYAGGRLVEDFQYELEGTPCGRVIDEGLCYYASGIQALFPRDRKIREWNVDSYLGAAVANLEDRAAGLIGVLDRRPILETCPEAQGILKIFAARAGVELERVRSERALRESVAERKRVAGQNEEMVGTLRALTAHMESVREEERTRIAREIHDELGQQLTAMRFDLASLKGRVKEISAPGESTGPLLDRVAELTAMVDSTIQTVRRIATELRPNLLDTFGLIAAIEWLTEDFEKRTGIRCRYEGVADLTAGRELSTTVFRICQEALTNVARHARATEATVRLEVDDGWLSLEVRDDGVGVSPETLARANSLGVLGMRERARIAGGDLEVAGAPGQGAAIRARLPLQPPETIGAAL